MTIASKPAVAEVNKCDRTAKQLYRSGMDYLAALFESIEARKTERGNTELARSRERVRKTERFLHELFPDEFADTSSGAE